MSNLDSGKPAAPASHSMPSPVEDAGHSATADHIDRRIEMVPPERLLANHANTRTHPKRQIDQIARSIERFGFVGAVLIDDANQIIAGHGRVEAAKQLGLDRVPTLRVTHLSAAERKAYAIADNRLGELAGWDSDILALELQGLADLDFDIGLTGFELDGVEIVGNDREPRGSRSAPDTERGAGTSGRPVSGAGDVWLLGPHQLCCGDAGDPASYTAIDAAIKRWQRLAGEAAKLAGADKTFAATKRQRVGTGVRQKARRQAPPKHEAA